jgi:hypothetical protein
MFIRPLRKVRLRLIQALRQRPLIDELEMLIAAVCRMDNAAYRE